MSIYQFPFFSVDGLWVEQIVGCIWNNLNFDFSLFFDIIAKQVISARDKITKRKYFAC